ncbi:NrfD/PsrC family molybdoenzyme membrane anchor subunit [uncultured Adlercreutzia sp.]|uniref:NrfD/PsrC family molybdoenzyme membrane anchor subunit n=1 Tax=uncultured Adlercreutzia sp. TaxID=875803 RepID=UPI0026F3B267|nr:NrfD/PsrC family molybdoenzyme membrane anchor subunit [uncultured Adlercreutzia sp.]
MVSVYIALYLFLAGAGGGAFLVGSAIDLVLRFRPGAARGWFFRVSSVTDAGLVAGPVLVAASAGFLVLDLGVPERALSLFAAPTPSLLSLGAWSIALFVALAAAAYLIGTAAPDGGDDPEATLALPAVLARIAEFACSIAATGLALFVVVYSGVYLAAYPSLPFLNTAWVPALFVASALASGLAVLLVVAFFRQGPETPRAVAALLPLDAVLVVVEAAALVGLMARTFAVGEVEVASAVRLMTGDLALFFWLGVVGAGLLAPLSVDAVCRRAPSLVAVALGAGCTLIGSLCLRFVLLLATERFNLAFMSSLQFWISQL